MASIPSAQGTSAPRASPMPSFRRLSFRKHAASKPSGGSSKSTRSHSIFARRNRLMPVSADRDAPTQTKLNPKIIVVNVEEEMDSDSSATAASTAVSATTAAAKQNIEIVFERIKEISIPPAATVARSPPSPIGRGSDMSTSRAHKLKKTKSVKVMMKMMSPKKLFKRSSRSSRQANKTNSGPAASANRSRSKLPAGDSNTLCTDTGSSYRSRDPRNGQYTPSLSTEESEMSSLSGSNSSSPCKGRITDLPFDLVPKGYLRDESLVNVRKALQKVETQLRNATSSGQKVSRGEFVRALVSAAATVDSFDGSESIDDELEEVATRQRQQRRLRREVLYHDHDAATEESSIARRDEVDTPTIMNDLKCMSLGMGCAKAVTCDSPSTVGKASSASASTVPAGTAGRRSNSVGAMADCFNSGGDDDTSSSASDMLHNELTKMQSDDDAEDDDDDSDDESYEYDDDEENCIYYDDDTVEPRIMLIEEVSFDFQDSVTTQDEEESDVDTHTTQSSLFSMSTDTTGELSIPSQLNIPNSPSQQEGDDGVEQGKPRLKKIVEQDESSSGEDSCSDSDSSLDLDSDSSSDSNSDSDSDSSSGSDDDDFWSRAFSKRFGDDIDASVGSYQTHESSVLIVDDATDFTPDWNPVFFDADGIGAAQNDGFASAMN